jgi:HK97 family phage major capsid protein
MDKIKKLMEARAKKITEARACLDQIKDDTPEERAADLQRQFEGFMSEAKKLEERAKSLQQLAEAEASLEQGDDRRPQGGNEARGGGTAPQPLNYEQAFQQLLLVGGDIHAMAPEARAALMAGEQQRDLMMPGMTEARAQVASLAGAGGHLVPEEAHTAIIKAMADWGPMFDDDFCTVLKTDGGGTIPIPGVDGTGRRSGKNTSEGQKLADTGAKDVTFTRKNLEDHMYDTEWLRVSIQLMTGSMSNVNSILAGLLGEELGRTANDELTIGSGAGEPMGVVTGASLGKTPASATAIAPEDVQELFHSVNAAYRRSPKFGLMFNDNTLLKLHQLKDGQGNFLLSAAPELAGKIRIGAVTSRYTINDAMADIGANNRSMIAGDMGKYFVRKIGRVMIVTARDSNFLPGFGMAGFTRLDGAVADEKAIKALQHPAA